MGAFLYRLSLLSLSLPLPPPFHLLSPSFPPTLFSLFITAFQSSVLQWDITFYYCIKNYYKSGILQQHKYITPKFLHIRNLGRVWLHFFAQGLSGLKSRYHLGLQFSSGSSSKITGCWKNPGPWATGQRCCFSCYLSAKDCSPWQLPVIYPHRSAMLAYFQSSWSLSVWLPFLQPAGENSLLLKGQCDEVRPSTKPRRNT